MTEKDSRLLYTSTRHLFLILSEENKTCRYETLSWKSYYNLLSKRKWRLYEEKSNEVPMEHVEIVQQRKQRKNNTQTTRKTTRTRRIPKVIQVTQKSTEESDFLQEFAAVPPPTDEQEQWYRNLVKCILGAECWTPRAPTTFKCTAHGCRNKIHHLCALNKGWVGDNEMHCFCSAHCMPPY